MLLLRLPSSEDWPAIEALYKEFDILLDTSHIVGIFVVERDGIIIAVGSLSTILESTLLVRKEERARDKIDCLNQLMEKAIEKTRTNGYSSFHVFFDTIGEDKTLKKSYGFVADQIY